jgi:hypothetical protein
MIKDLDNMLETRNSNKFITPITFFNTRIFFRGLYVYGWIE